MKGVNKTTVINAATCGLQKGPLAKRLAQKPVCTITKLFDKLEEYTQVEEDSAQRARPGAALVAPTISQGEVPAQKAVLPSKVAEGGGAIGYITWEAGVRPPK